MPPTVPPPGPPAVPQYSYPPSPGYGAYPAGAWGATPYYPTPSTNGMAVASLVLGIVGLFTSTAYTHAAAPTPSAEGAFHDPGLAHLGASRHPRQGLRVVGGGPQGPAEPRPRQQQLQPGAHAHPDQSAGGPDRGHHRVRHHVLVLVDGVR